MLKKIFISIILFLTLNSCSESKEKSNKNIYKNGKSSVQLKILNGKNFLIYNTPTRVDFEWKNIDLRTTSIYGLGIKILEADDKTTKTEINVPRNYLDKDTLSIKLNFEVNGKDINTEFTIPLKEQK